MSWLAIWGMMVWAVIVVLSLVVCYLSSRPNQRRKKRDKNYKGPERRVDSNNIDFLQQPVLKPFLCMKCGFDWKDCKQDCKPKPVIFK